MENFIVKDREPNVGESVIYKGQKCYVTYNPFTKEREKIGFLYQHPIRHMLYWREVWPCDEYQVQYDE